MTFLINSMYDLLCRMSIPENVHWTHYSAIWLMQLCLLLCSCTHTHTHAHTPTNTIHVLHSITCLLLTITTWYSLGNQTQTQTHKQTNNTLSTVCLWSAILNSDEYTQTAALLTFKAQGCCCLQYLWQSYFRSLKMPFGILSHWA